MDVWPVSKTHRLLYVVGGYWEGVDEERSNG